MNPDGEKITYFGITDARGKRVQFGIKAKDRTKHMYVIGKTGMGKSTLLENMAIQDIQNGNGLAFIDPHGGTAERLLDYIPQERIKDVIYFAPFDTNFPISFNVMEDVGADKRFLVVDGLMSVFEKIWVDAWSARMAYILKNTLFALLESPGSTLLGVNRMLIDKEYRKKVVENITDPAVKSFWVDEFAKYTERFAAEATPAIQNKIGQFTANSLIRNVIGQPKSSLDFRAIMDDKKIFIANLSKGLMGEGNARLLGAMLVTKIYLAAMSRADLSAPALQKLPDFYLYVDEFQSFANKSFADILSEARKYKLSLTLAHQYVEQMEEEVRDAVFGNVGTTITFRVGPLDAELLEKVFTPQFTAEDLVNLGLRQIYLSLQIDGIGSPPFSATTMPPIPAPLISYKDQIIDLSRKVYGHTRAEVEEDIKRWHEPSTTVPSSRPKSEKSPEPRAERPAPPRVESRPSPPSPPPEPRAVERPMVREPVRAATPTTPPPPQQRIEPRVQRERFDKRSTVREETESTEMNVRPTAPKPPPRQFAPSNKGPSQKHMSALRDALQMVITDKTQGKRSAFVVPNRTREQSEHSSRGRREEGRNQNSPTRGPSSRAPSSAPTSNPLRDALQKVQVPSGEKTGPARNVSSPHADLSKQLQDILSPDEKPGRE